MIDSNAPALTDAAKQRQRELLMDLTVDALRADPSYAGESTKALQHMARQLLYLRYVHAGRIAEEREARHSRRRRWVFGAAARSAEGVRS